MWQVLLVVLLQAQWEIIGRVNEFEMMSVILGVPPNHNHSRNHSDLLMLGQPTLTTRPTISQASPHPLLPSHLLPNLTDPSIHQQPT